MKIRRLLLGGVFIMLAGGVNAATDTDKSVQRTGAEDRALWRDAMLRIATPVLENAAAGTLKTNMPYESNDKTGRTQAFSYLEAFGRTLCGVAPWLEVDDPYDPLKEEYRALARKGLSNAVNPDSPDYMEFDNTKGRQPLVDAAYLAQGILRAPVQLWQQLPDKDKSNLVAALKGSRTIKPHANNWLLFASMVEAAILELTNECDTARMLYGIEQFRDNFYKGDGMYGDGASFHMDYYNSFVIQPMMLDVLAVMNSHGIDDGGFTPVAMKRHQRLAEILERMIAPDGTYPVLGRSISACRFGAFHSLSQAALNQTLPKSLSPAQVRSALTAVILRQLENPDNFDSAGWLRVGFAGSQPEMAETYVNTGSLYHCTTVFLPLGLPADNQFWTADYEPWTGVKAWSGARIDGDHAIKD